MRTVAMLLSSVVFRSYTMVFTERIRARHTSCQRHLLGYSAFQIKSSIVSAVVQTRKLIDVEASRLLDAEHGEAHGLKKCAEQIEK